MHTLKSSAADRWIVGTALCLALTFVVQPLASASPSDGLSVNPGDLSLYVGPSVAVYDSSGRKVVWAGRPTELQSGEYVRMTNRRVPSGKSGFAVVERTGDVVSYLASFDRSEVTSEVAIVDLVPVRIFVEPNRWPIRKLVIDCEYGADCYTQFDFSESGRAKVATVYENGTVTNWDAQVRLLKSDFILLPVDGSLQFFRGTLTKEGARVETIAGSKGSFKQELFKR